MSGRGAGGFIGALLGGMLVDKFENSMDLLVAVPQTVASLAVLTIPFSPGVSYLWFHYLTLGVCSGIMNIGNDQSIQLSYDCFCIHEVIWIVECIQIEFKSEYRSDAQFAKNTCIWDTFYFDCVDALRPRQHFSLSHIVFRG